MSDDFNRWPAQEPPDDFADRAVAAMLSADRAPRRLGPRWFIPLAAAAILVGSASWAMIGLDRAPAEELAPSADVPPPAKTFVPDPAPPVRADVSAVPEPADEPPPSARPAPVAKAPEPESEPESAPDAGSFVVVPRCICEHGTVICHCVD
jgi:hypothetical protein